MDKKFFYSGLVFLIFSALPIGGFMLSVAMYPDSALTSYMVGNFGSIIIALIVLTVSLIGVVFYVYSERGANRV